MSIEQKIINDGESPYQVASLILRAYADDKKSLIVRMRSNLYNVSVSTLITWAKNYG